MIIDNDLLYSFILNKWLICSIDYLLYDIYRLREQYEAEGILLKINFNQF